jgi:hypothetical protein
MFELLQIRRTVSWGLKQMMMKVVNTNPGMGNPMTEEEMKNFLANNDKNILLEFIDEKREPNLTKSNYYWLLL